MDYKKDLQSENNEVSWISSLFDIRSFTSRYSVHSTIAFEANVKTRSKAVIKKIMRFEVESCDLELNVQLITTATFYCHSLHSYLEAAYYNQLSYRIIY